MKFYIRSEGVRLIREADSIPDAVTNFVKEVGRPSGIIIVSEEGFDTHDNDSVIGHDALNAILNPITEEV